MHVAELRRLGAKIDVKNNKAYINGNTKFIGAELMSSDLRASVSLVLAAMVSKGKSIINRIYHLDRGYENIEHKLKKIGVNAVAICSNDAVSHPEDSFENMIEFSKQNNFNFPYLIDETQEIAKGYDAVCTPDFFGYNKNLELQYRGRLRELKNLIPVKDGESDLLKAMKQIAETSEGPKEQIPSAGCSIKLKTD